MSLPEGWREVTLGELAEKIYSGGTPNTRKEEYWNGDFNWLSSGETGQKYISQTIKTITQAGIKNSSTRLANKNDTVIATAGQGNTRGQVSLLGIDTYVNQSIIVIKVNQNLLEYKWIFYNLSNRYKELRFISESNSVRGSLTTKMLNDLIKLSLPPLQEQKAIANILSSFDEKILLLKEQNETLEQISQGVFREWFVKFNYPDTDGKRVDSEFGDIPDGWRVNGIRELIEHNKITIKPQDNPAELYHHYSLPAYDNGKQAEAEYGSEISSNKYKVIDRSFLVSKLNPSTSRIWAIYEPNTNAICSTEFQVIKPVKYTYFGFVYGALTSYAVKKELSSRAHGTSSSHQRVKPDDILDVPLLIPTEELVVKYSNIVNGFLEKINNNEEQIQILQITRDTLLPKLMSGEVRVEGFGV